MALIDNILHYYKFDSDADDSVGSNNGTVNGASNVSAKINNGYSFDGNNDTIITSDTSFGNGLANFSINVWFKTSVDNTSMFLCGKNNGTDNAYQIMAHSGGNMLFIHGTTVTQYPTAVSTDFTPYADNNWHMATFTYNGSTLKAYVDNVEIGTPVSLTGVGRTYTKAWTIGTSGSANYWNGLLDEVGFWNRALTTAEINRLYNNGLGKQYPFPQALIDNILAYYKMDSDANDSVGSEDFTVNGATNVAGHINNCYSFDGNDSLVGGDTTMFDGLTTLSVNLWFFLTTSSAHQNCFSKLTNVSANDTLSFLYLNGNGWNILVRDSDDNFMATGNSVNYLNAWKMLTVVLDGSDLTVYVNGSQIATTNNPSFGSGLKNSSALFHIGRQDNAGTPRYIDTGKIDEVGIWSRALSTAEITELYNSGSGLQYPFSVSGWSGKIFGISSPAKVDLVILANIGKINTV